MSDNEMRAAPVTEMTADEAKEWAWSTLKADLGPRNWTVSESGAFFGFFCWGWNYRAQYERQRPALTDEQVREIAEKYGDHAVWTNFDSIADCVEAAIREAIGRGERG